jgi:hypothetical protein
MRVLLRDGFKKLALRACPRSATKSHCVIPAKLVPAGPKTGAGIQFLQDFLDPGTSPGARSGVRWRDGIEGLLRILLALVHRKWMSISWLAALALGGMLIAPLAFAQQFSPQQSCGRYSDSFDTYNPERWQEVLFYSKARGEVAVEDGRLTLTTPKDEPCEIQVYSLFCMVGDFDIQAEYDFSSPPQLPSCRFNAGLVVQTPGDEKSYKCYVAAAQKEDFLFRARLDASGDSNLEKHKGEAAPQTGFIRIVRKGGQVSFLASEAGKWRTVYTFKEQTSEKLRVRFKLQSSGDEEGMQPCPVTVKFDNFKVNACDGIVEE